MLGDFPSLTRNQRTWRRRITVDTGQFRLFLGSFCSLWASAEAGAVALNRQLCESIMGFSLAGLSVSLALLLPNLLFTVLPSREHSAFAPQVGGSWGCFLNVPAKWAAWRFLHSPGAWDGSISG